MNKKLKNLLLIIKYPFLCWRNRFTGKLDLDLSSTELDAMPDGWRQTFGEQMCDDIKKALLKNGGLKALFSYRITQIKEKYGSLCWYDFNGCREVDEIVSYYEDLSRCYCIYCGKPVRYITTGWVEYLCEDCFTKYISSSEKDKKKCRATVKDIPVRKRYNPENDTWVKDVSKVDFKSMWGL